MFRALLQVALNGVAFWLADTLRLITYKGDLPHLLLVGLIFGLINLLVKPVVKFFSLPLIVLTLGLFYLVINGAMIYLTAWLLPHLLVVRGCMSAILAGLVISLFNWVVGAFTPEKE